jgi:hypothetical protein
VVGRNDVVSSCLAESKVDAVTSKPFAERQQPLSESHSFGTICEVPADEGLVEADQSVMHCLWAGELVARVTCSQTIRRGGRRIQATEQSGHTARLA